MSELEDVQKAIAERKKQLAQQLPPEPKPMSLSEIQSRIKVRKAFLERQQKEQQSDDEQPNNTFSGLQGLTQGTDRNILNQVVGGAEAAGATLYNTIVEAIGGAAAIAGGLNPFAEEGRSLKNLNYIRDLLSYDPRTPEAQKAIADLGNLLKPVAEPVIEFSEKLRDDTYDLTGSPTAAGLAYALPAVAAEVAGFGVGSRSAKAAARASETEQLQTRSIAEIAKQEADTGIPQMTSDIFEPKTRLGKFMQAAGELATGKKRTEQQDKRVKSVSNLIEKFDVEDGAQYESRIVNSLKNSINDKKGEFSQMYTNSSRQLDQYGAVPLNNLKKWAQAEISKQLKMGSAGDKDKISDLQALLDAPEDLSFELVKEIRSGVGNKLALVKRGAPVQGSADQAFLSQAYKNITKDMRGFADFASPSLAQQWKAADVEYSAFATGANKNAAKQAVRNGDTTPEVINTLLFSTKNSDVQFLVDNLGVDGIQAAKQSIIQKMASKSTNADGDISPNRFIKQIEDNRNRIGKVFGREETQAIFALKDALSKTRRAQDSAITTPTGQQLAQQIIPLVLITEPLAMSPTAIQWMIETKKARNLLIKRKAAKTVKERQVIGAELEAMIREQGLIGAGVVSATTIQDNEPN